MTEDEIRKLPWKTRRKTVMDAINETGDIEELRKIAQYQWMDIEELRVKLSRAHQAWLLAFFALLAATLLLIIEIGIVN
jgi:hypothetical protein